MRSSTSFEQGDLLEGKPLPACAAAATTATPAALQATRHTLHAVNSAGAPFANLSIL